jgi:glycerol-3-phosphate dehydrogenase
MGEDLIDRAETTASLPHKPSRTATLKLHGCPPDATEDQTHLRNVYGSDSAKIDSLIRETPELASAIHPRLPYLAAHVIWAARFEMAQTIEDVLARRTRSLFLDATAAIESADFVGKLLQQEMNRSDHWTRNQFHQFSEVACGYTG